MARRTSPEEIEIAIGPHAARAGWSVLRVTYPRRPEHEAKVARAVEALFAAQGSEGGSTDRPKPHPSDDDAA